MIAPNSLTRKKKKALNEKPEKLLDEDLTSPQSFEVMNRTFRRMHRVSKNLAINHYIADMVPEDSLAVISTSKEQLPIDSKEAAIFRKVPLFSIMSSGLAGLEGTR